ncbi:MAG: glycoside hydrolase family 13 protein [Coprothermobacterota bacterium]|nr:glycoside hydrolase family 13 protein [Coprothermobacterota bacterium]
MKNQGSIMTPDWVKGAIFYQIFPDRFAKSGRLAKPAGLEPWEAPPNERGFKGGDLLGVAERLDYLCELGINALYFNPIFQSPASHRYHTFDYYQVDPLLGGNEALKTLLDQAHRRGIKVILDGVFNHTSRGFYPFNHVLENEAASLYCDWFTIHGFPLRAFEHDKPPQYACWWGLRELPKLNTENPAVRRYLFDVAAHWLRFGIDGWRLDVPLEISTSGFWEEFHDVVKGVNPEAYILAEIWNDAPEWLEGDTFDATMNYRFNRACLGFFGATDLNTTLQPGGYTLRTMDGPAFARELEAMLEIYDWEVSQVQFNLLSSHDEPRFLAMVRGNRDRLRLATLFQMMYPGAPCLYYGDEVGIQGGLVFGIGSRETFPWQEDLWDIELLHDFQRFAALRRKHPALTKGQFRTLAASGSMIAFLRSGEGESLIGCFNAGTDPASLAIPLAGDLPLDGILRDAWSSEISHCEEGNLKVSLPALSAKVLIY